jgi:alpha-L-arabinofuranosidase
MRMAIRFVLLGLLAATVAHGAEAKGTIQIDASRHGPKLNPRMYGIFLEEINHGVDGGLYGELIGNRAFEDSRPPEGEITLLRSGRLDDNNTLDHPAKVAPATARMANAGTRFSHEFPPFSLTVMRLKAQ